MSKHDASGKQEQAANAVEDMMARRISRLIGV